MTKIRIFQCGSPPANRALAVARLVAGTMMLAAGMALLAAGTAVLAASGERHAEEGTGMAMTVTSKAFGHQGSIPRRHTCEGEDISPPLSWSGLPQGTRTLALIIDDPDAPDPANPRMTWVHWVLYDIPASASGLAENVRPAALPAGTREGINDWKRTGYGGPCPPIGRHRYFHKLYALDVELGDLGPATKADVERAMEGHVLAEAVLVGTYQKGN